MANVALIAPLLGTTGWGAWVHVLPWEGMFILFAALAAGCLFRLQRAMPEHQPRRGETLSFKRATGLSVAIKNRRFVAGALALDLSWPAAVGPIAQSPIIIISGEQPAARIWSAGARFWRAHCR